VAGWFNDTVIHIEHGATTICFHGGRVVQAELQAGLIFSL